MNPDAIINLLSQLAEIVSFTRKCEDMERIHSSLKFQEEVLTAIQSYTTIISQNVQRLTHMYLNSAIENMRYAQNSSGEALYNYIAQAKNRFIDASVVENNENLIISYLGLAFCQIVMGENNNVLLTLQSVKKIHYINEEMIEWNSIDYYKRAQILEL